MPRRRSFRPALLEVLEGRIALSAATLLVAHPGASDASTATTASASLEKLTTTYANGDAGTIVGVGRIQGTTEIDYRLTVPTGSETTTTTDSITLPGTAGHVSAVDVTTTEGNTVTQNVTTTLPDGVVTIKAVTAMVQGDKTIVSSTLYTPGFGTQVTHGVTTKDGSKSITNETIVTAGRKVYHYHRVTTQMSPLEATETSTTRGPSGAITNHVQSTTVITPLALPKT